MLKKLKLTTLEIKEFRNLWYAQATSQFGDAFYMLVFPFMVLKFTGSSVMVGYMGAVETLPYLLFSPFAGVLADRMDRKKIMISADIASTALLLLFAATVLIIGQPPIALMFIVAFALSTINVFFAPAKGAAIPMLVPKGQLQEANGLSTATQNMMPVIGVGLSGTTLAAIEKLFPHLFFPMAIFINALAFAGSAYFLTRLPQLNPEQVKGKLKEKLSVFAEYKDGIAFILKRPVLRVAMLLEFLVFIALSPFMTIYVTVNKEWFGDKYSTFASIEFAYAFAAVIGSLIAGRLLIRKIYKPYLFGLLVMCLTVAGMAFSKNIIAFIALNVLCGIAVPFSQITVTTFLQVSVPENYLGRINSILSMMTWGAMPVGMVLAGVMVENYGVTATFLVEAACFGLICILGVANKSFRNALMPTGGEVSKVPNKEPITLRAEENLVGAAS